VRRFFRAIRGYFITVPLILIVIAVGEWLPFMRDLDAAIKASRQTYLNVMIALLIVGWGGFFAAIIYGAVTGMPSRRLGQPIPEDSTEQTAGGSFDVEVSFREVKQAWRQRRWRDNRVWRFTFFMMATVVVAIVGMFGLFFVLGPSGIRLIVATALLYATAMTVHGFLIN